MRLPSVVTVRLKAMVMIVVAVMVLVMVAIVVICHKMLLIGGGMIVTLITVGGVHMGSAVGVGVSLSLGS